MEEGEVGVEPVSDGCCPAGQLGTLGPERTQLPLGTSCIRRDDNAVVDVNVVSNVLDHRWFSVKLRVSENQ